MENLDTNHSETNEAVPPEPPGLMLENQDNDHHSPVAAVAAMNVPHSPRITSPQPCNKNPTLDSKSVDRGYAPQNLAPNASKAEFIDGGIVSGGKNLWPHPFRKRKQLKPYSKPIPTLIHERFLDLRELYADSLNQFTRSLPHCQGILMSLQVLGEDEASAEPYVFVQCDRAIFKRVNNFFKQPFIKFVFEPDIPTETSPRLQVIVCPLKPRQLAESLVTPSQHNSPIAQDLIRVFSHLLKKLYRLVLYVDKVSTEDDGFELDLDSFDAITGEERTNTEGTEDTGEISEPLDGRSMIGRISMTSPNCIEDGRNLDWALTTIKKKSMSLPNMIKATGGQQEPRPLEKRKGYDLEERVVVISSRGPILGSLSTAWSFMMLSPGKSLVRTFLLTFDNGTAFQSGDSGAWVVDAITYEVYDHIVADDVLGRGYAVP
ncbi:uncharacterized protein LY89DRAFT_743325 [Mollisia scopiformis]|uniref:Uncharacterized protein n=1 Tax=Mollisia scopiformis TaxID=149040 RepID=A0A132B3N3_MOLSC|nr:uncharacterized protein LY89DRAFT_743325 [Mollisia scopiformis]KUJ06996.1 hypothetical protein LY89DRAFT_743325 [Mollisia scopiformis]